MPHLCVRARACVPRCRAALLRTGLDHRVRRHQPGLVEAPWRLGAAAGPRFSTGGGLQEASADQAEAEGDVDAVAWPQHRERHGIVVRVEEGHHLLPMRRRVSWAAGERHPRAQLQREEDAEAVEGPPALDLEEKLLRLHLGGLLRGGRHAVQVPDALAVGDQVVGVQLLGEHALRGGAQRRLRRRREAQAVVVLRPELHGALGVRVDVERAEVHVA
mmetsp:Transcript_33242/g.103172  ORF Transcript_33242/g.103172 Transcript_33242/m.103172 type:complete len:217 (-) Transcript_33242:920-1570(-)